MSSEVGSGHVSIFPVLTGFKGRVAKETQAAGVSGAKAFTGGFKGAGTTAGRTLGRDMKAAMSTAAGDLATAELRKLNSQVASASNALSKARLKQQDEAGKTRVAEVRLQEAISKSGIGSSQAVAAEERLASARRNQAAASEAVASATARLKAAQDAASSAAARVASSTVQASGGIRQMVRDFGSGLTNASAAQSAFSGVAGSIGGLLRAASDVSGLTTLGRLARLEAQLVSKSFTSMATMVGGGLAKAWSRTRSWLGGIGSTVKGAFAPMVQYVGAAATLAFSPFRRLGSSVAGWMSPVTTQVKSLLAKLGPIASNGARTFASTFGSGLSRIVSVTGSALAGVARAAGTAGAAAGRALASGLQATATTGVATVAAGIGVSLTKGIGRLTAIDTARAKLTGLGNSAEDVKTIMGDALASVKGTSFGLGEAATVAASAVAANIKPGEQLQSHLKNIANNASAAGLSMEEMGGIFNRAATQANGVQNDVISQLADRGIPIYKALADQLGVTAGEVFKMASEGKIDFETFSKAAEAAAGTVAQEMGKTVPGAAKNFMASLGRIGANSLEGLYAKVGPLIQAATSALAPIEERAKAFGTVLTNTVGPAMDWITGLLNRLGTDAGGVAEQFSGVLSVLAPVGGALAAMGAGGLSGLLTRIPLLGGMLGGLTGPLAALGGPLGIAAAALAGFFASGGDGDALAAGITDIVGKITDALPGVIQAVTAAIPGIVNGILSAIPELLTAATGIVSALIQGIITAVPLLVQGAVSLIGGLVDGLVQNLPLIITAAITLVTTLITGIIDALPTLIEAALTLVQGLLTGIVTALPLIIQGGIQLLMALISGIIDALPMILDAALQLVSGLLQAIIDNLPMIIDAGIQLLLSLVTGLIDALPELITAAINLVLQLVTGLITMLPQLIEAGVQLVVSLITGLIDAIPQIIEMLPQIIEAIWNGFADVDWAGLGAQIVQGLIDGLGSMIGSLGDMIGDLASSAWDGFTSFFGIHSPSLLMRGAGVNLVRGAVGGVDDEADDFADSLTAMAKDASSKAQAEMSTVSADVSAAVTGNRSGATTAGGGGSGPQINLTYQMDHMDPEIVIEAGMQQTASAARRLGV